LFNHKALVGAVYQGQPGNVGDAAIGPDVEGVRAGAPPFCGSRTAIARAFFPPLYRTRPTTRKRNGLTCLSPVLA
jgi:hypothetical protein